MVEHNKQYLLMLNRMPGVGPVLVQKLLRRWPDLDELFRLSASELVAHGLTATLAQTLTTCNRRAVDNDWNWQLGTDCHLITWGEAAYPALLREISAPPAVLYVRGQLACLNAQKIAIVGTRHPSASGEHVARAFSHELARLGFAIVSGLARGIDGQAHAGALEASGETLAVMATGIDGVYPHQHRALAEKICTKGALISEFPLKTPPIAGHFPRRNRIISGLSIATLVVEAALKSGSLVTARYATEQNRDVFAVPGCVHNPKTQGCHWLVRQGAVLVTSVQDILDELQLSRGAEEQCQWMSTNSSAHFESSRLMQHIGYEILTIDQLMISSGLCLNEIMTELAELELNGLVQAIPGGYRRCRV